MNKKLMALALMTLAGTAAAQPASFTDLGTHTSSATFTQPVTLLAANDVQWFRIVLPAVTAAEGYVDIWNTPAGAENITDSMLGLYDNGGNLAAYNDDAGPDYYSQLTFGSTTPSGSRPTQGGGALAFNGANGELAGGEYYLAVQHYGYPWTFDGGFGVTNSYTGAERQTVLNFRIQAPGTPVPPSGVGAVSPSNADVSTSVLYTVTVTPGLNPASTGIQVVGNFTAIGGGTAVVFHDDGLAGDAGAGDGVYSVQYTIPAATPVGSYTIPVTVSDAQARSSSLNLSGSVRGTVNLGTISSAQALNGVVPPAEGLYYQFTITQDASAAANRYLDIDTNGSSIDTEIGLFSIDGTLIDSDDDDGVGAGSLLSYGSGGGTAQTDGGNGSTGADGALPAGTYLLVVSQYNTGFADGPSLTFPAAGAGGAVNVNITLGALEPATPPADATDLGQIGAGAGGAEVVTTHDTQIDPGVVTWLKFSTGTDALQSSTNYMDIDTEPTADDGAPAVGSINDTEIGLYNTTGGLLGADDDDGSNYHSQLSFGDSSNLRAAFGNGAQGDGREGDLVAGTYYLAVGTFNTTFNNRFGVASTSTASGVVQVNFRTNIPGGGGTGNPCGAADVAGTGGVPGADNHLDNNDFVVFIDYFFNHNALADQGSIGGQPGADNIWDNNDFVVFIDNFFNAPGSCR